MTGWRAPECFHAGTSAFRHSRIPVCPNTGRRGNPLAPKNRSALACILILWAMKRMGRRLVWKGMVCRNRWLHCRPEDAERGSARTISHVEPSAIPLQRQSVSSVATIRVRQLLRGARGHPL